MTYAVTWTIESIMELSRLLAADGDSNRVKQAADWVDYTLRRTPLEMGESRGGADRVWYGDVLGTWYRVDQDNTRVRVLAVAPARRR